MTVSMIYLTPLWQRPQWGDRIYDIPHTVMLETSVGSGDRIYDIPHTVMVEISVG